MDFSDLEAQYCVEWTANDFWNKATAGGNKMKWPNSDHTYFQQRAAHTWLALHNNNTQGIRLFYYFATRLMAQDHAITSLCTGHLLGAQKQRHDLLGSHDS